MRKQKIVYEHRGVLTGQGSNKTEAKRDLEQQIDSALESERLHVETRFGSVIVVNKTLTGWQTMLLSPGDVAMHGTQKSCSSFQGFSSFERVLQGARLHAAQNAWTAEGNDFDLCDAAGLEDNARTELLRWCTWQRCYRILRGAELTENTAHQSASSAVWFRGPVPIGAA